MSNGECKPDSLSYIINAEKTRLSPVDITLGVSFGGRNVSSPGTDITVWSSPTTPIRNSAREMLEAIWTCTDSNATYVPAGQ